MTKKLLLADDSITIQKVIGIIFATEDYQLIVTENGDEAFDKALQEYPDLVIADIAMPGKDGFELCEAIKSDPRLPHTSVLLLPGTFEHFDEERAQAVGADGWINKPFESQALLDKVAQLLEVEPIRLDAAPAAAVAEAVETEPAPEEEVVDLASMEEPEGQMAAVEEESPEDIWDAVSFEEDDLQDSAQPVDQSLEVAAEDVSEESIAGSDDFPATEDLVLEESPEFDPSPESEIIEEPALELTEEEAVDFSSAEEEVDFSAEGEELLEPVAEETEPVEEVAEFDEEPLDLTEEAVEPAEEFSAAEELPEEELLELAEEDISEDPITTPETEMAEEDDAEDEEEILDLGVEDILEEEPLAEEVEEEPLPAVEEESLQYAEEEELAVMEEPSAFAEEEPSELLEEPFSAAEEEPLAEEEESPLTVSVAEEVPEGEIDVQSAVVEDEGFFFDDAAAGEEQTDNEFVAEPAPVAAEIEEPLASMEQVERQLRELSADELKEVVSKVAGPMIEKLANEMLAQIAWEVVPDLAEAMIREEIRKIKQGVE